METQIFTKENLDVAAKALQQGEIVSFPTETVYGLGAIATSQEAVLKVFEAKGRPSDNPLIVHISDIHQMTSTVEEVPEIALTLAKAFWPGPLTIIIRSKPAISLWIVTFRFGQASLKIRCTLDPCLNPISKKAWPLSVKNSSNRFAIFS